MLRHLLAASLVLLLSSASAPLSAGTNDFDLVADCKVGLARGEWNLPAGDQLGTVRGIFVDSQRNRIGFEGVLVPTRVARGTVVVGRLEGAFYALKKDDRFHQKALATVSGTWAAGPGGLGRFRASIVELEHGNSNKAVVAAGKLVGQFTDRPATGLVDTAGVFGCRWKLCQ